MDRADARTGARANLLHDFLRIVWESPGAGLFMRMTEMTVVVDERTGAGNMPDMLRNV